MRRRSLWRLHQHPLRLQRRLDRHRLHGAQQLGGDRGVDARPAERHASRQPQHQVRPVAAIDGLSRRLARVGHPQPTTAACAGEQPGQQRPSAAPGLRAAGRPIGVGGELRLVALVLRPVDVALVMILEQNLPLLRAACRGRSSCARGRRRSRCASRFCRRRRPRRRRGSSAPR